MTALSHCVDVPVQPGVFGGTGGDANAWLLRYYAELVSRATAVFAWLDPNSRDEAVAEVIAKAVASVNSADRRGQLHRLTPYWLVVYASRQYRQGRRFAGDNCRCVLSEAARIRHGVRVASLDDDHDTDGSRPRRLRESLADRDAEKGLGLMIVVIALYMVARCDQQQAIQRSRTELKEAVR